MAVAINGYPIGQQPHPESVSPHSLMPEARIDAESIVQTLREAILILNPDLRVVWANRSFYKTFRVEPMETEGKLIFELGNRQWNVPGLRTLLTGVLPRCIELQDFEVEHDFFGIGRRTMLLNAKKLQNNGDDLEMILLAIEDITERKRAEATRFSVDLEVKKVNEALRTLVLIETSPVCTCTRINEPAQRSRSLREQRLSENSSEILEDRKKEMT